VNNPTFHAKLKKLAAAAFFAGGLGLAITVGAVSFTLAAPAHADTDDDSAFIPVFKQLGICNEFGSSPSACPP